MNINITDIDEYCDSINKQNKQTEKVKYDLDRDYCHIEGWMLQLLNLKGNDLIVYAKIYGFTLDGTNWYEGGLGYLAAWTNSTKQGVMKNLNNLVEKGFIKKQEIFQNGVKFCKYQCVPVKGIKESLTGIKQSLTNNTITNNIDNNNIISTTKFNGGNEQKGQLFSTDTQIKKKTSNAYLDLITDMFDSKVIRQKLKEHYEMIRNKEKQKFNLPQWKRILEGLKRSINENKFVNEQHIANYITRQTDEGWSNLRKNTDITEIEQRIYGSKKQSSPIKPTQQNQEDNAISFRSLRTFLYLPEDQRKECVKYLTPEQKEEYFRMLEDKSL